MFKRHFDRFVVEGEHITCTVEGVEYRARLVHDWDSKPDDFECYGPRQVQRWVDDEWNFFTLVISAHVEDCTLGDYMATLGGLEGNLSRAGNKYLRDAANEMLPEAIEQAEAVLKRLGELRAA